MFNRETLEPYRLGPAYPGIGLVGDGYDQIGAMRTLGWTVLSSWGSRGWDLGDWPFVAFYVRGPSPERPVGLARRPWELATNVEGDVDRWAFESAELREQAIDYLFAWYAVSLGQEWAEGWDPEDPDTVPEMYRGPYSKGG